MVLPELHGLLRILRFPMGAFLSGSISEENCPGDRPETTEAQLKVELLLNFASEL